MRISGNVGCTILAEALAHELQVFFKLARVGIGFGRRAFACALQTAKDIAEEAAVEFNLRLSGPPEFNVLETGFVVRQFFAKRFGDSGLPHGRADAFEQLPNFLDVVVENRCTGFVECFLNAVGGDEGIAVAIAADPRAEIYQRRKITFAENESVNFLEGVSKFLVETRQGVEQRHGEIFEPDANFVGDARPAQAYFVGLPKFGDLRLNDRFAFEGFGIGEG